MLPRSIQKTIISNKIVMFLSILAIAYAIPIDYMRGMFVITPICVLLVFFRYLVLKNLLVGRYWAWLSSVVLSVFDLGTICFPFAIVSLVGLLQKPSRAFFKRDSYV